MCDIKFICKILDKIQFWDIEYKDENLLKTLIIYSVCFKNEQCLNHIKNNTNKISINWDQEKIVI